MKRWGTFHKGDVAAALVGLVCFRSYIHARKLPNFSHDQRWSIPPCRAGGSPVAIRAGTKHPPHLVPPSSFANISSGQYTCSPDAPCLHRLHFLGQVKLSFSGTGEAAFAGVGMFAHPDVACRCEAGYYLDVASAPVRQSVMLPPLWHRASFESVYHLRPCLTLSTRKVRSSVGLLVRERLAAHTQRYTPQRCGHQQDNGMCLFGRSCRVVLAALIMTRRSASTGSLCLQTYSCSTFSTINILPPTTDCARHKLRAHPFHKKFHTHLVLPNTFSTRYCTSSSLLGRADSRRRVSLDA